jgi:hypothetical protein
MVERIASTSQLIGTKQQQQQPIQPKAFFGEDGGKRGTSDTFDLLPWDALRVSNHFDSRNAPMRSTRKPFRSANSSSQMASIILGSGENGDLTGAHRPRLGTHVLSRDGGVDALVGGVGELAKEQLPRLRAGARWRPALTLPLREAPSMCRLRSAEVLRRFGDAQRLLRDRSQAASFHTGHSPCRGTDFSYAIGDVSGGAAVVHQLLGAMLEAVEAISQSELRPAAADGARDDQGSGSESEDGGFWVPL